MAFGAPPRSKDTSPEAANVHSYTTTQQRSARPSLHTLSHSKLIIRAASLGLLLLIWQIFSILQSQMLVPSPVTVAGRLLDVVLNQDFTFHMGKTLLRVLVGLAISLGVACLIGVPMGLFRRIERFLEAYILLGLTIPGLSWALIAVMIVGISDWAAILAIVATTSPMIILNIWQGTKSIDTGVLEMGQAFRANGWLTVRHIITPQLSPFILAGTRLGLALAWKIVVLSEMFGLSNGVGYQLSVNFSQFDLGGVIAWTIAFTIVMAGIEFLVLRPAEHRLTRWRPDVQGA